MLHPFRFTSQWPLVALALCIGGPASAATYTVATTGSDSNPGTAAAPFATFRQGVTALQDGDTLVLEPGTYVAGCPTIQHQDITIMADGPTGSVILDGTNAVEDNGVKISGSARVTLKNLSFQHARIYGIFCVLSNSVLISHCDASYNGKTGILTGNSNDVTVEYCTADANAAEHGIYLSQSGDRLQVVGNWVRNNNGAGLQINAVQSGTVATDPNNDSISSNCLVANNTLSGNGVAGGAAINFMGLCDSTVVNNRVLDDGTAGIAFWDDGAGSSYGCKRNLVAHNSISVRTGRARYGLQLINGSSSNRVFNNVVVCGVGPALQAEEAVVSDYNCYWAPSVTSLGTLGAWRASTLGTGNDVHSFEADPLLTADAHLQPSSPARDAGLANVYPVDFAGTNRPLGSGPDLGCFEEVPVSTPAAPLVIYGDWLAYGWTADKTRVKYALNATSPVYEGNASISATFNGPSGSLALAGPGVSTSGRSVLKFAVSGGAGGGQALTLQAQSGGTSGKAVSLQAYVSGSAGGWTQYEVPLSVLLPAGSPLSGLTLASTSKLSNNTVNVDYLRLQ